MTEAYHSCFILWLVSLLSLVGCTTRSSSKFNGTVNGAPTWEVKLYEGDPPSSNYSSLGKLTGTVKKNFVFFPNPTKKQVDEELIKKARSIGADAVINIEYKGGIGFSTWAYMEGIGTAIKYKR